MKALQATYGDYCKNHDDAIDKVGEYSKQDAPERIREFLAVLPRQIIHEQKHIHQM